MNTLLSLSDLILMKPCPTFSTRPSAASPAGPIEKSCSKSSELCTNIFSEYETQTSQKILVVILGWQQWAISEQNLFRTYFFENNHEIAHNSTFFNQHLEFPHAISTIPLEIPCNICNIPPISLGYVTHVFSFIYSSFTIGKNYIV